MTFIFFSVLICLMVLVMYFDCTKYTIPNWLNAMIALLYPFMVFTSPVMVDWKHALVAALLVFIPGYIIFIMRWMGGGDIKLFTVTALWIGLSQLSEYVMVVALLGGAFSLIIIFLRKLVPVYYGKMEKLPPRMLQMGEPLPYGLAIATGFSLYLVRGLIPGLSAM